MADFSFVNSRLATGAGLSSPEDAAEIIKAGITHVVDCTDASDDTALFMNMGVMVLWNPTADDGQVKDPDWFSRSLAFALPALVAPLHKVYAHCSAGVNRGPSTCYCIMRALGFSSQDAESIIRAARPQVQIAYKNDADNAIKAIGYE